MQQLEKRVREHEQNHQKATAELQSTARKAADENKLLRMMLKEMGVEESTLETWLVEKQAQGVTVEDEESVTSADGLAKRKLSTSVPPSSIMGLGDVNDRLSMDSMDSQMDLGMGVEKFETISNPGTISDLDQQFSAFDSITVRTVWQSYENSR